jgi:uncharacterized protein
VTLPSEILSRRMRLPRADTHDLVVERDLPARMDDGAILLADRYAPRAAPPGPTVLVRSPYGRANLVGVIYGRLLAERGLQTVVQSVRGTFGSGGEFNPFDERADGLATLAWLRRQPWHEGLIGMTGASYLGLVQWAVARDADGALGALAPAVTASQFHGQAFGGGSISLETAASWLVVVALQEGRLGPLRLARGLRRLPPLLDRMPLGDLDEAVTGRSLAFYHDWLIHSAADDPYWTQRDYSAGVEEISAPVQLVGGWHDIFLPWLVEDFLALRRAGRETQLVVGPWTHTAPGLMATSLREAIGWLRGHLLGDRRLIRAAPVRVHMGGGGGWREWERWPPPEVRPLRLHLQAQEALAPAPPAAAPSDRYRYDPHDPTPSLGGPGLFEREPVRDNRPLEARADVLVYTAPPQERDLELAGPVEVDLHVRSSLQHFDVFARLCDVGPDGASRNVCDALARVTPERFEHAGDGGVRVAFALWPTAHRFAAGQRVRLLVAGGAHPRYARNPGTGDAPATATRLRAGEQEVLHDPAHPSAVVLPALT